MRDVLFALTITLLITLLTYSLLSTLALTNTSTVLPAHTTSNNNLSTTITQVPTPTPIPTIISPTPTPNASLPTPTSPTLLTKPSKTTYLLNAINTYRNLQGFSPVVNDPYTCTFAKIRAAEIVENFSHDGFQKRIDEDNLPYSSYHEITENIAINSDYKKVVDAWIASEGHRENLEKDTPYACVGSNGNYFTYESWKP